uniref:Uncharacterized protein n=1 Tax=Physcomitrium patens TaxID=3218 RepID=A0A2K1JZK7_PHYPA|nr:hypothetical protein PHYPA_014084 [Physcomitrium patens]
MQAYICAHIQLKWCRPQAHLYIDESHWRASNVPILDLAG